MCDSSYRLPGSNRPLPPPSAGEPKFPSQDIDEAAVSIGEIASAIVERLAQGMVAAETVEQGSGFADQPGPVRDAPEPYDGGESLCEHLGEPPFVADEDFAGFGLLDAVVRPPVARPSNQLVNGKEVEQPTVADWPGSLAEARPRCGQSEARDSALVTVALGKPVQPAIRALALHEGVELLTVQNALYATVVGVITPSGYSDDDLPPEHSRYRSVRVKGGVRSRPPNRGNGGRDPVRSEGNDAAVNAVSILNEHGLLTKDSGTISRSVFSDVGRVRVWASCLCFSKRLPRLKSEAEPFTSLGKMKSTWRCLSVFAWLTCERVSGLWTSGRQARLCPSGGARMPSQRTTKPRAAYGVVPPLSARRQSHDQR